MSNPAPLRRKTAHAWLDSLDLPLLPPLPTVGDLARWLMISPQQLEWFADLKNLNSRGPEALRHYFYRMFRKRSGNFRLIESPKRQMKALQRQILWEILNRIPPHDAVHGFRRGRSIETFAAPHTAKRVVLRMDIRDFFPSVSRARVEAMFRTFGFAPGVALRLGAICTHATPSEILKELDSNALVTYGRHHLPQGAPTSPAVANLCCYHVDCRLTGLAKAAGAVYTRYADDLAFSGGGELERGIDRFAAHAGAVLLEEGFTANYRKMRVQRQSSRQSLTGLVVNAHLNVRRDEFDTLKAILFNCARFGPASQNRDGHKQFRSHLEGRIGFVEQINPAKGARLRRIFETIDWRKSL